MDKVELITYFVVWLLNTHRQERQRQELESRLAAAVVKKQGSNKDVSIRLADLTNFGWDKVYIFHPYTPITTIDAELGSASAEVRHIPIDMSDSFNLLVFTQDGKVVSYLTYPTHLGEFSSRYSVKHGRKGFSRNEAVFDVVESSGRPWLVLHQQNESSKSLSKQ